MHIILMKFFTHAHPLSMWMSGKSTWHSSLTPLDHHQEQPGWCTHVTTNLHNVYKSYLTTLQK